MGSLGEKDLEKRGVLERRIGKKGAFLGENSIYNVREIRISKRGVLGR